MRKKEWGSGVLRKRKEEEIRETGMGEVHVIETDNIRLRRGDVVMKGRRYVENGEQKGLRE